MTDAADYLQTVMGVNMSKVSVLTGWQSSLVTAVNGGLSFTPCMATISGGWCRAQRSALHRPEHDTCHPPEWRMTPR